MALDEKRDISPDTARAVSKDLVEIARQRFDRFASQGELNPGWYDPDFVWDMSTFSGWPEKQRYSGVRGVQEFLSSWLEAWEEWRIELVGVYDAGPDKTVTIARQLGTSKSTGMPTDMTFAQVWTWRDQRYLRMR